MKAVFIDTSCLSALNNPRDQHHSKSKTLLNKLVKNKSLLISTDYVADEVATLLLTRSRNGYKYAMNMLDIIFEKTIFNLEWISKERVFSAKKIFARYNKDKKWSFTDCTSFVVMKELRIKKVFTFDVNFKQMGFEVLE